MTGQLGIEDFSEFYEDVNGFSPFGWQVDLLEQVVAERRWPELIDLPTGTGKTSVLDVAVFVLALNATEPPEQLWAPRRTVMIVDRRIVVDQAHERAGLIAATLRDSVGETGRARGRVANALNSLGSDLAGPSDDPLYAGLLRGGTVLDSNWSLRPDRAVVLSSTVDQVGSRLLFRGYGVSDRSASIHAGLLGSDTLMILDEVHLSQPFAETLDCLGNHQSVRGPLMPRNHVVMLSATPGSSRAVRFPANPLRSTDVEPQLSTRLRARKPVRLRTVPVGSKIPKADQDFAKVVAAEAVAELAPAHVTVLGVVVNRVDTARRVAQLLEADRSFGKLGGRVTLITGRMRPVDRDRLLERESLPWVDRSVRGDTKQVIVATQCIEAGADFDLDGLVTECASADALRQRFGRVDRRGVLDAAGTPARGVVLLRGERAPDFDAVYGKALSATWRWLTDNDPVDFGIEQLVEPPDDCIAERLGAPMLTSVHLRALSQTSPRPTPDHVVARWLHGDEAGVPNVWVIWRSELSDLAELEAGPLNAEVELTNRIGFCPPLGRESIEVPLYAARAWLSGRAQAAELVSDTESMVIDQQDSTASGRRLRWVLWRDQQARLVSVDELRPGDTIIVPCSVGGIARGNWDPSSTDPVDSEANESSVSQRNRIVVSLSPRLAQDSWQAHAWQQISDAAERDPEEPLEEIVRRDHSKRLVDRAASELVHFDGTIRQGRILVTITDGGFVGISCQVDGDTILPAGISGSSDDASFIGAAGAPLGAHLMGVGEIAARFAAGLALPAEIVSDMRLAGQLHDLGKLDRRFQSWLVDGGPPSLVPLAKSFRPFQAVVRCDAARTRSGYPRGARHEMLSFRIAEATRVMDAAVDRDLVAHLVLSHHGHARPVMPAVVDPQPVIVDARFQISDGEGTSLEFDATGVSSETNLPRAGSGVSRRFNALCDRYGEHGLAWLEAIFRLADHRRSEWEAHQSLTRPKGRSST